MHSKVKILCYVTIILMLLSTPFLLDTSPDGKTYAMGFLGSSPGGHGSSDSPIAFSTPSSGSETSPTLNPPGEPNTTTRVPEPATLLLLGAGAVSLAVFKKKFRKQ